MFIKRSTTGMALHYVNIKTNSQNQTFSSWFKLELHQDYIDCLRDLGHPPPTETHALIQDLKELERLRLETQELKEAEMLRLKAQELKELEESKQKNQDQKELERLRLENQELKKPSPQI